MKSLESLEKPEESLGNIPDVLRLVVGLSVFGAGIAVAAGAIWCMIAEAKSREAGAEQTRQVALKTRAVMFGLLAGTAITSSASMIHSAIQALTR